MTDDMSLRVKIFLSFFVVVFFPLGLIGILTYVNFRMGMAEALRPLNDLGLYLIGVGALGVLLAGLVANALSQILSEDMRERTIMLEKKMRQLAEANMKEEAMLQSIGEGLVATDKFGMVTFLNQEAEHLLGKSKTEIVGKLFERVIPLYQDQEMPLPSAELPVNLALKGERVIRSNITPFFYKRSDQTWLPVAGVAVPVVLEQTVIGVIMTFRDATKEFSMDKAKSEFVSLASHQLRTPLSAINWYTEMMLYGDAGRISKKQKKFLEEIYYGNQHMVRLVNALLNVSRIDLGTLEVRAVPTDMVDLTRRIVLYWSQEIKQKNLHITESYADLPKLSLDIRLMRIVVDNLLSNAVHYTPNGGSIAVAIERMPSSVRLSVKDTGYGIPQGQQDKIFTKLFRADNVRGKDTKGTGLGLYIVKSILNVAGGKIWFTSEENKGTTFFVEVPLAGMSDQ